MNASLILDGILLIVLALIVWGYARRGFMAGLLQFVGNIASLLGALFLSQKVAPLLFEHFLRGSFITRMEETIARDGTVDIASLLEQFAGFLPEQVQQKLVQSAGELLSAASPDLAQNLVTEVVEPLLTPIIAIVVFFVAFALCRFVVGFLVAVLTNFNKIPLVGGVNRLLGVGMGFLAGLVDLYILLCALWAVMVITGGNLAFLNEQILGDSLLYAVFAPLNPFLM